MSRRMRRPETVTLTISHGDTLTVRKYLTAGEYRAMQARHITGEGRPRVDLTRVQLSKCIAYLLDWTFTDADDTPIVIADQPPDAVEAALNALDPEAFIEVAQAIDAHEVAVDADLKNERDGGTSLPATSPSRA